MVLDHVPQKAGLFVVAAAALDAQLLARGDLHVVDVVAVPDRLEDGVAEPEHQQVLHRLLAQVVVDAEDLPLVHDLEDEPVEGASGGEIASERLLDDHPSEVRVVRRPDEAMLLQLAEQRGVRARRSGEIEEAVASRSPRAVELGQRGRQALEGCVVLEGPRHVTQPGGKVAPHFVVDRLGARELADCLSHLGLVFLVRVSAFRDADGPERGREVSAQRQVVERRQQLAVRQIAARPEHDDGTWLGRAVDPQPLAQRIRDFVVLGRIRHLRVRLSSRRGRRTRCAAPPALSR